MTNLTALIIVWAIGVILGGMAVQWANDRIELAKLREVKTRAKKANKVVKHKQLIYKGEGK